MGALGSCFSHLSLWNCNLTEVLGPSKALKHTEVEDLILGEGNLYGFPWASGKGHEGKEHCDPRIAIPSSCSFDPALVFSVLINVLVDPNLPLLWIYGSNAAFPCPSDGSLHADVPGCGSGSPWGLVLLGVTAVSWELFWQGFFNPCALWKVSKVSFSASLQTHS